MSIYHTILWTSVEFSIIKDIQLAALAKIKDTGAMAMFTYGLSTSMSLVIIIVIYMCKAFAYMVLDHKKGHLETFSELIINSSTHYIIPFVIAPVLALAFCILIANKKKKPVAKTKKKKGKSVQGLARCQLLTASASANASATASGITKTKSNISPMFYCELYTVFVVALVITLYILKLWSSTMPSMMVIGVIVVVSLIVQTLLYGIYRSYGLANSVSKEKISLKPTAITPTTPANTTTASTAPTTASNTTTAATATTAPNTATAPTKNTVALPTNVTAQPALPVQRQTNVINTNNQ